MAEKNKFQVAMDNTRARQLREALVAIVETVQTQVNRSEIAHAILDQAISHQTGHFRWDWKWAQRTSRKFEALQKESAGIACHRDELPYDEWLHRVDTFGPADVSETHVAILKEGIREAMARAESNGMGPTMISDTLADYAASLFVNDPLYGLFWFNSAVESLQVAETKEAEFRQRIENVPELKTDDDLVKFLIGLGPKARHFLKSKF